MGRPWVAGELITGIRGSAGDTQTPSNLWSPWPQPGNPQGTVTRVKMAGLAKPVVMATRKDF